jgi:hypothetical protein
MTAELENQTIEILYEYRNNRYSDGRSDIVFCQGRKSFIKQFITQNELSNTFGGFILSEDSQTNEEYLGVWGRRKCQTFRRVLRERGASFHLKKNLSINLTIRLIKTIGNCR